MTTVMVIVVIAKYTFRIRYDLMIDRHGALYMVTQTAATPSRKPGSMHSFK
jgi:hypothetical protein